MAVSAQLEGEIVYILNFDAPVAPAAREAFYAGLASIPIPKDIHLYVGGDFNCTQHGVQDRSFGPTANDYYSPSLDNLLQRWHLHDSVETQLPNPADPESLRQFYSEHHTHEYPLPGRGLASSRLDRWYGNDKANPWMAATHIGIDGLRSDHKGVAVYLRSPKDPVRIKKPTRVFPVPSYMKSRADHVVRTELGDLVKALDQPSITAEKAEQAWDVTKTNIVVGILRARREAKRSRKSTYRKKLKRLYRRLKRITEYARVETGDYPLPHDALDALQAKARELTERIATHKREWARTKAQ
ncbi:hypothetical protein PF003_g2998 [Phytophthora fragariae]|nr:hypothetical protein PF003_g2998 [Phytophthora fragariae]